MSHSVGIVGATGAVGREMLSRLDVRGFPVSELRLFATPHSHGHELSFRGDAVEVRGIEAAPPSASDAASSSAERRASVAQFAGLDVVLFAAGAAVSRDLAPAAVEAGAVVVDNSSAFRMEQHVPLVVPEVNPTALEAHRGLVANPNCSTIQMVVALKPIMDAAGLSRVVVATYQSASGTGKKGSDELERAARSRLGLDAYPGGDAQSGESSQSDARSSAPPSSTQRLNAAPPSDSHPTGPPESDAQPSVAPRSGGQSKPASRPGVGQGADSRSPARSSGSSPRRGETGPSGFQPEVFPRDIGFNLFPLIDRMEEGCHCREELKMVHESRKILDAPDLAVCATTVRVPVFVGHSLAIWVQTETSLSREECLALLRRAPGTVVVDEMAGEPTPTPLDVAEDDRVWVGRVREDPSSERCLMLWVVANNLRKGAATNAVQIAEELASRGLLSRKA